MNKYIVDYHTREMIGIKREFKFTTGGGNLLQNIMWYHSHQHIVIDKLVVEEYEE